MGRDIHLICSSEKAKYFLKEDLTRRANQWPESTLMNSGDVRFALIRPLRSDAAERREGPAGDDSEKKRPLRLS